MRSPGEAQGPDGADPLVVSVAMGYGHLRAAQAVAHSLGTTVVRCDLPPMADHREKRRWQLARRAYEQVSRLASRWPYRGVFSPLLRWVTRISSLDDRRAADRPTGGSRLLDALLDRGLCAGLAEELRATGRGLVTTFYAPALAADRHGLARVACVVTDTDVNRVWAPTRAAGTRILYFTPNAAAARRLVSFGVPPSQVEVTGFPLPLELLGDEGLGVLRRNLAHRLGRLDPHRRFVERADVVRELGHIPPQRRAPLLTFAVGGAGAQVHQACRLVRALSAPLLAGELRLAIVAGTSSESAGRLHRHIEHLGLGTLHGDRLSVLSAPDFDSYYHAFNDLLARTDMLWTKPSEMVFYAALGLPLILSDAIGHHEEHNEVWLAERGAAIRPGPIGCAWETLSSWLADGRLAEAAWNGFNGASARGVFRITQVLAERGFTRS